jgi:hypothetical protein
MSTEHEGDALNRVSAKLLDQADQLLSTGSALFDIQKSLGKFWPQAPNKVGNFQSATSILLESGERLAIWAIEPCQAGSKHFHFRIAKIYPGKTEK